MHWEDPEESGGEGGGGGIGMGNTCNSMADSCQYMTKPTTIRKVISLQLIKINEKNININKGSLLLEKYLDTERNSCYKPSGF